MKNLYTLDHYRRSDQSCRGKLGLVWLDDIAGMFGITLADFDGKSIAVVALSSWRRLLDHVSVSRPNLAALTGPKWNS